MEVKVKIREKLKYNSAKLSGYKTDKKSLFNEIPKALRFEVAMSMYDGIAKDLILFNHRDEAFVVAIMPLLNPLHVFD